MSNAPDIPARAVHRDDAARPQPRDRAARRQDRRRGHRHHEHDDLGQPLGRPSTPTSSTRRWTARTPPRRSTTRQWLENDFIPTVQKRGAAIIEARGASSAASAANAAIDHVHDWVLGTPDGDWVSMAVPSDGSYGVAGGDHLRLPVHLLERRVRDRPGPGGQRLLAVAHRRDRRRARRGARGRQAARPDLARRLSRRVACRARRALVSVSPSRRARGSADLAQAGCQPWPSRLTCPPATSLGITRYR